MISINLSGPRLLILSLFFVFSVDSGLAQRTANSAQRFKQLDANKDGKVTREEAGNPAWFDRLDQNGDDVIVVGELPGRTDSLSVSAGATPDQSNISYGDHEEQRLDLYLPDGAKGSPVMLYIHGGGWRKGDKSSVHSKAFFFTDEGWIFASANYRLIPGGEHPKNVDDVAAALAWLHEHVAEHGGDPDKIFVMGHSAGCHLVALVATDDRPLQKQDLTLGVIKGVIANDTQAYDIPRLIAETPSELYSGVFGDNAEMQRDASPIHHIEEGKEIPPFLILYSMGISERRPNPKRPIYANDFRDALREAGISAEVVDGSDRTHGQINQWLGGPQDNTITNKVIAFLTEVLEGSPDQPGEE